VLGKGSDTRVAALGRDHTFIHRDESKTAPVYHHITEVLRDVVRPGAFLTSASVVVMCHTLTILLLVPSAQEVGWIPQMG
jgi:hypothetical protein